MVLSGGNEIDVPHLPASIVGNDIAPIRPSEADAGTVRPLHAALRDFEHQYLLRALRASAGKRTRTAEMLGISRKTLWEKLRQNGTRDDMGEVHRP